MVKQPYEEVPGNAVQSQRNYEYHLLKCAQALMGFDRLVEKLDAESMVLKGLTVKFPRNAGGEYFIIVRAEVAGSHMVAFHSATQFQEGLVGLVHRLTNRSLKWKDDMYAQDEGSTKG